MSNNSGSSGLSLFSVVGVIFVILKIVGVIDWSWWLVTAPFWIGFVIFIACLLVCITLIGSDK